MPPLSPALSLRGTRATLRVAVLRAASELQASCVAAARLIIGRLMVTGA